MLASLPHTGSGLPAVRPARNPRHRRLPRPSYPRPASVRRRSRRSRRRAGSRCRPRCGSARPARHRARAASAASSKVFSSYRLVISVSLANRISTSCFTRSRNAARWRSTQNASDSDSATCRPAACAAAAARRNAALRRRRVEQIALQVGHRRIGDEIASSTSASPKRHAGAEIGVHRALPVRRDQDQAARRGRTARQRRRGEVHADRGHVMAEHVAQLVVRDLAEIGDARAERGRDRAGVARRSAAAFLAGRHGGIQRLGRLGVDQHHRALVHVMARQERVVRARHHIDDGVADAEDVEACVT